MISLPIFEMSPFSRDVFSGERQRMQEKREAMRRRMDQMFEDPFQLVLQRMDSPFFQNRSIISPSSQSMQQKSEQSENFCVQVSTTDFRPHEISVKIEDRKLIIDAKHEKKISGSFLRRECHRQFSIPPEVDPETLEAVVTDEGILRVRSASNIPEEREIELKRVSNEKPVSREMSPQSEEETTEASSSQVQSFLMPVKIKDFKPEEITVAIKDRELVVIAKHAEADPDDKETIYTRTAYQDITIPPEVDLKTIVAELNKNGLLTIKTASDDPLESSDEVVKLDVKLLTDEDPDPKTLYD